MADNARMRLSDWKFWMGVAYFMLVWVSVATPISRTQRLVIVDYTHASHVEHNAEARSSHEARVAQCLAQIPVSRQIDKFLDGVREFHITVTDNNKALLAVTPKTSPLYTIRLNNWKRLAATIPEVSAVRFPVPTKRYCRSLK